MNCFLIIFHQFSIELFNSLISSAQDDKSFSTLSSKIDDLLAVDYLLSLALFERRKKLACFVGGRKGENTYLFLKDAISCTELENPMFKPLKFGTQH